jgi:hypothetical protein
MFKTDNSLYVFVDNESSNYTDNDLVTTLTDGEAGIVDVVANNLSLAADTLAVTGNVHKIVQKINTRLKWSPSIKGEDVIKVSFKAAAAETLQKTQIGFNGATGSIVATNNNEYKLNLLFKHDDALFAERSDVRTYHFTSDAAATQEEVASAFVKRISLDGGADVSAVRLCDEAGVALGTGAATSATISFTKGSTHVSGFANVDDATTNATIIVGGYLRVGTATTSPVYKVVSMDTTANTLELDAPYQEASGLFDDTGLENILAAAADAAEFGIELEGDELVYETGLTPFNIVSFETTLAKWGSTPITAAAGASKGSGVGEMVKDLEWFSHGAGTHRGASHPASKSLSELQAVEATNYNLVTIEFYTSTDQGHVISGSAKSRSLVIFAIADATKAAALYDVYAS